MPLFLSVLIFFGLVVGMAALGMKMYVRPKEALERVVSGGATNEQMPVHPSLAMHQLIAKLGNFIPHSPKDVTVMQRRLIRAGIRNESALKLLYGAKVGCGIVLPILVAFFITPTSFETSNKFFSIMIA